MKRGDQFYLGIQITDNNNQLLDMKTVDKVEFTIQDKIKIYDGISKDVLYDEDNQIFKVLLKEEETFDFDEVVEMDARVLFKKSSYGIPTIFGTKIIRKKIFETLEEYNLDETLDETLDEEEGETNGE